MANTGTIKLRLKIAVQYKSNSGKTAECNNVDFWHFELLEVARVENDICMGLIPTLSPIGRRFLRGDRPAKLYSWT